MTVVQYKGNQGTNVPNTSRGPSPYLWTDCPVDGLLNQTVDGVYFYDDFIDFGIPGTQTTEINLGRYKVFASTGGNWAVDTLPHAANTSNIGGVISVANDAAGEQATLGTAACPFYLTTDSASVGKLWFEARIATTGIATDCAQLFVGLCENNAGAFAGGLPLGDANATSATPAMIGWVRLEDGLGVLGTYYQDHATSWTAIQASSGTIAANTWTKVGFTFDPTDTLYPLKFYQNGVLVLTTANVPASITKATLAATTHLDAKGLGPCIATYADAQGTTNYLYLDWWRCAQIQN